MQLQRDLTLAKLNLIALRKVIGYGLNKRQIVENLAHLNYLSPVWPGRVMPIQAEPVASQAWLAR